MSAVYYDAPSLEDLDARLQANLAGFLARAAATPFVWGGFDCCLWLADWILARTGADPATEWRGAYRDERGARRILRRRGGMVAHLGLILAPAGHRPVAMAAIGDVGVLSQLTPAGKPDLVGGICTGPRWAMLSPGGLASRPAHPIATWRIAV